MCSFFSPSSMGLYMPSGGLLGREGSRGGWQGHPLFFVCLFPHSGLALMPSPHCPVVVHVRYRGALSSGV